jgi:hypothetical protein
VPIAYAVATLFGAPTEAANKRQNPCFDALADVNFNLFGETTFFVRG